MKCDVVWNTPPTLRRVLGGGSRARAILAEEFLKYANRYVRMDSGQLEASSHQFSNLNEGRLVWSTPYARQVYYIGRPSRDKNPLASLQWAEVAYKNHRKELQDIAEKLAKKGG